MAVSVKEGSCIVQAGQPITRLFVIIKGSVSARFPGAVLVLSKGDVLGLTDLAFESYSSDYTALEDCVLADYAFDGPDSLTALLKANPDYRHIFLAAAFRTVTEIFDHYVLMHYECGNLYDYLQSEYQEYRELCRHFNTSPKSLPGLEELTELKLEEDVPDWMSAYYDALKELTSAQREIFASPGLMTGFLMKLSQDLHTVQGVCMCIDDYKSEISYLLLNENHLDFFDLFTELYATAYRLGGDTLPLEAKISRQMIQIEANAAIDRTLYQERAAEYKEKLAALEAMEPEQLTPASSSSSAALSGSLQTILEYAGFSTEQTEEFTQCLNSYKLLQDKSDQSDGPRKLRLRLTKLFNQLYKDAFLLSLKDDKRLPTVLNMFFKFGYLDEELAGEKNAAYLYSIADSFQGDASRGVFTMYEWLRAVYEGRRQPSRNEFDNDFEAYLREQRASGNITPAQEKEMAGDNRQKVLFELDNLFPTVNKITFGRITTFCPVFSEHNVLKDPARTLVTPEAVCAGLNTIRSLDYGAFYRETIYSNPELGIPREPLDVECLPDVILLPNMGTRGVMWQEIEGRRRTTPARMFLSVFHLENLLNTLVRMTGDYRWEMCKRIQGARWNDLSDRSLTSEYCDYLQFYRKNHELSTDMKDKIKNSLQKAKNNFKEMFIQDYTLWILFEGNGSPRLNKLARGILFTYCPFASETREKLKVNPLYREMMEHYEVRTSQKCHHLEVLLQKLKNNGTQAPPELEKQYQYLKS